MERGIFNLEGFAHESVEPTCAIEIHRRQRNAGGHEQQVRSRTKQKLRTPRRVVSIFGKSEKCKGIVVDGAHFDKLEKLGIESKVESLENQTISVARRKEGFTKKKYCAN